MGMEALEFERVYSYVGNGAPVLIRRALGEQATEAEVEEGLEFFLEYYREHALDYTRLYPGMKESLDRLSGAGKRMAVLTNKPVRMSKSIVEGLGVAAHFFQVYGGNSFDFKKPNPIGVETLMRESGISRERTMMIGDSAVDVNTADQRGRDKLRRDLWISARDAGRSETGSAGGPHGRVGRLGLMQASDRSSLILSASSI